MCISGNNSENGSFLQQAVVEVNLVPRAFPSKSGWGAPIFWGKSPGDEVVVEVPHLQLLLKCDSRKHGVPLKEIKIVGLLFASYVCMFY